MLILYICRLVINACCIKEVGNGVVANEILSLMCRKHFRLARPDYWFVSLCFLASIRHIPATPIKSHYSWVTLVDFNEQTQTQRPVKEVVGINMINILPTVAFPFYLWCLLSAACFFLQTIQEKSNFTWPLINPYLYVETLKPFVKRLCRVFVLMKIFS